MFSSDDLDNSLQDVPVILCNLPQLESFSRKVEKFVYPISFFPCYSGFRPRAKRTLLNSYNKHHENANHLTEMHLVPTVAFALGCCASIPAACAWGSAGMYIHSTN